MPRRTAEQRQSSWTLGRGGTRVVCTLMCVNPDEYVLGLSHNGRCILVEPCRSREDALSRSIHVFERLGARPAVPGAPTANKSQP